MTKFDVVSRFVGQDNLIPKRSTEYSAGYDMVAAEDVIIPPYVDLYNNFVSLWSSGGNPQTLEQVSSMTKSSKIKPTLVSTGVKVYLSNNQYLKLVSRSSIPLKHWLICANGEGIIDADYADNQDNEGEIFFQMINLSPFPIKIQKGERICQGIIQSYELTDDDNASGQRVGGFGSTNV